MVGRTLGLALLIALAIGIFGWGVENINQVIENGPPPSGSSNLNAVITGNTTGAYAIIHVNFPNKVWVKGIVVTKDTWILTPNIDAEKIASEYRVYPVEHEYNESHTFIVPLSSTSTPLMSVKYPVWENEIVIGEKTYPLDSFGKVVIYNQSNWCYNGFVTFDFIYLRHTSNPSVIRSTLNMSVFDKEAIELARENATYAELVNFSKSVAETVAKAIENGSILIGYPGVAVMKPSIAKEEIEKGNLRITVTVSISGASTVGEIVRNTSIGQFKYFIKKVWHRSIKYDAGLDKVVDRDSGNIEYIEPAVPVPIEDNYAVVVLWAKTPYSPLHAYGLKVENNLFAPLNS